MSAAEAHERFFREADTEGNGYLTLDELTAMLRKKGYRGSDKEIQNMFRSVNTSGNNQITLEEFKIAMGDMPPKDHHKANMRAVFREFDLNGDGTIDRSELGKAFESMGEVIPPEDLDRMMKLADRDGSGTMNYEEFIAEVFGEEGN